MTDSALAQVDEGRHRRVQDPHIGDELVREGPDSEAALFWERGKLGPIYLAGTDIPGEIRFDLAGFDDGPWWDPDLMTVDPGWIPPFDVDQAVADIFGDLGLVAVVDPPTDVLVTYDPRTITPEEVEMILRGGNP